MVGAPISETDFGADYCRLIQVTPPTTKMTPTSTRMLNTSCRNNRLMKNVKSGKVPIIGETTMTKPVLSAVYIQRTPIAMLKPDSTLHFKPCLVIVVSPIVATFPLFTFFISLLFRQEVLSMRVMVGVILVVGGVTWITLQ